MPHYYWVHKLIEQRKNEFLQAAQTQQLSYSTASRRAFGIVDNILLHFGGLLVAAGEALRGRYAPQPYTSMHLEVK